MALANGLMAGITTRDVTFNQDVKAIIPADDVDPLFLSFAFWGHERQIRGLIDEASHGTKRLTTERLGGFAMPLPPLKEQQRIAGVLGALDAKVEHEEVLADQLHHIAAQWFCEMFPGVADRVPLSELCSVHKAPVQPASSPDEWFEHFSIPAFDAGGIPRLEPGSAMLSGKTLLPDTDCVLFSKLNPATRRVWWPSTSGSVRAVCSPEFVSLLPKADVPPSFLYAAVREDVLFQNEVRGRASGTTGSRQRIRPADLLACTVPAPNTAGIDAWEHLSMPLYRRAQTAVANGTRLRAVRDELLPRLVAGELRVATDYDADATTALVG